MRLKVYIDHRELRSRVISHLKEKDIEVCVVNDQITDYIINRQCGIERKTINDFFASIIDKRIFRQVDTLCREFTKPLLLLEGGGLYSRETNMRPNAIRGAMLWISAAKRVPIIRTMDARDSAEFIRLLALKGQKQNQGAGPLYSRYKRRTKSFLEQ